MSDSSGQTKIVVFRESLVEAMKEHYDKARPYTGEYHMGIVDFINTELLYNPPIDWNSHPTWKEIYDSSSTTKKGEEDI